jgi:hypothetical protein
MRPWLRELFDWRGSGVAIPILDGPLKPNQQLETAEVLATLRDPSDLVADARGVLVADGDEVLRWSGGGFERVIRADGPITALAAVAGGIAVAIGGRRVRIHGGRHEGREWTSAGGTPFNAINALAADGEQALLVTDGSCTRPAGEWKHDLLERGRSGSVHRLELDGGRATTLASNLGFAFGAMRASNGSLWVSESWSHRLVQIGGNGARHTHPLSRLPAYPSRLSRSPSGGCWLTMFACRTQLVELVLRQRDYCETMMREVDPEFWVAPALAGGRSFLEPLQGAGVKQMGVIKPWAPPRAYGLVVRLNEQAQPRFSLHSRVDGANHGVVAAAEHDDHLYVLAKGPRRVLRVALNDLPPEFGR